MGKTCQLCASAAKVYCENDNAFLCASCDETIHANSPFQHKRTSLCELCCGGSGAQHAFKNEQGLLCACKMEAKDEEYSSTDGERGACCDDLQPSSSWMTSELGLVPTCIHDGEVAASLSKEELLGSAFPKEFDVFDLDDAWMDRLETGFDFDSTFDFAEFSAQPPAFGDVPVWGSGATEDCGMVPVMPSPNLNPSKRSAPAPIQAAQAKVQRTQAVAKHSSTAAANAVAEPMLTREERVARYREKRKNRTFQKTIRYASRKAYAEVRPRIKGRFARKDELAAMAAADQDGVVPCI